MSAVKVSYEKDARTGNVWTVDPCSGKRLLPQSPVKVMPTSDGKSYDSGIMQPCSQDEWVSWLAATLG